MYVYNEQAKQKEKFEPLEGNKVKMYVCGPTVYDYFHAGNARCFVIFDFIRRVLEYAGYEVLYVQNFTDIDDKMIERAARDNISVEELAEKFTAEYFKDAEGLGIAPADFYPRATGHIAEIIEIIEILINKNHAYRSPENADVYFDAKSFKNYGRLSGKKIEDLKQGERVDSEVIEKKRDPIDFALWKSRRAGEPYWDSPWGEGRPGWHIECSAMVKKYFGATLDFHCGGKDLEFPHHENETAQSECAFGQTFARYWLHNGMININSEKMSKSAGNFFTARDIAEKYGYMPLRFFILSSNYRMPLNFSETVIKSAQSSLERIFLFKENLSFAQSSAENPGEPGDSEELLDYRDKFKEALFDDFNSASAVSVLFELIKQANIKITAGAASKKYLETASELYNEFCGLFGFAETQKKPEVSGEYITEQIEARAAAKKNKDFKTADEIRENLKQQGIILEDTPEGTKWRFSS
ncbi:MAG: cysteine--tRNA ligase [Oscillospiraceae bacterium]|nr:cysteine--tRNA ligase [Oscillospiraceae bacterium]